MLDISLDDIELPKKLKPTSEQEAIVAACVSSADSLMIDAMAGCAKTTSLELSSQSLPVTPSLALAFNVKIKKELEKRFPSHFEILTLNGLGHRAWCKAIAKRCSVNQYKLKDSLNETLKELNVKSGKGMWANAASLIKGARHAGLIPEPYAQQFPGLVPDDWPYWEDIANGLYIDLSDELIWVVRRTLTKLIKRSFAGDIDYDDQIYMSALFGGIFPRFPTVMVDEAQDLSPLNYQQVRRCAAGRVIVCGDPRQAIYAFRGADSSSMGSLRKLRESWMDLPLTLTFRCPKTIVERQQSHAPGFTAAPSNPEGTFEVISNRSWSIKDIQTLARGRPIAILCRNNAPIIACALRIIRSGTGCAVIGNEIGKGLISLSRKILPGDGIPADSCLEKIADWAAGEIGLARANGKEERVAVITDKAECLRAVIDSGPALTSGQLRDILGTMFNKQNLNITLSTGHKAKGLEWPVVVHLDPHRIPSKFAKMALDGGNRIPMQQDLNLKYVIETRAMDTLIEANLEDMTI